MSLFRKKYLYKVVWAYGCSLPGYHHTEIIEAKDPAHAWKKIRRQHGFSLNLISLEEINMNKLGGKIE